MINSSRSIISIVLILSLGIVHSINIARAAEGVPNKALPLIERTEIASPSGFKPLIENLYDEKDRIKKKKMTFSAQIGETEYFYDSKGNNTKQIDKTFVVPTKVTIETTTTMLYDSHNFLISKSAISSLSNGATITSLEEYENDPKGRPIKTIKKYNNRPSEVTMMQYDDCGRIIKLMANAGIVMEDKYTYVPGKGCLPSSRINSWNNKLKLKQDFEYEYNAKGDPSKTIVKSTDYSGQSPVERRTMSVSIYDEKYNLKEVQEMDSSGNITTKVFFRKRSSN